jgi:hypothetical protein
MPKVEKVRENLEKCSCQGCSSYNDCARKKDAKLFCAEEVGKSACDFSMMGCLCEDCPVHEKNNLKAGYYCMHGSADYVDELNKMI